MMTRAELDAAIERVIDAERGYLAALHGADLAHKLIPVGHELRDARADLKELIDVLDRELAFAPEPV